MRRARDGKRITDIKSVNDSINLFKVDEGTAFGATNTVYISVPDTASDCSGLSLPSIPVDWDYYCVTSANTRNIDGTGWVPIDFSSISSGSPLSKLPIDPVNTDTDELYYSYVTDASGGNWEFNIELQSVQQSTREASDGGDNASKFEIGSDLTLAP